MITSKWYSYFVVMLGHEAEKKVQFQVKVASRRGYITYIVTKLEQKLSLFIMQNKTLEA